MCLSPEVDLVAGIGITVVAIDALRHNRSGRTLPLALLPAVFAAHSLASALVWWGLLGVVPQHVGDAAAAFYMLVAFGVLPAYVPISLLLLEPPGRHRDALLVLSGLGVAAGLDYLLSMTRDGATYAACDAYIDYQVVGAATISGGLYVAATCGAMLVSSHRPVVLWGVANAVAVGLLVVLVPRGMPSLWCAWAACTSVFVAWFLRQGADGRTGSAVEAGEGTGVARGSPWRLARTIAPGTGTGRR